MPLTKLQIAPGIDKQNTEYGAEGRWVDGNNIRFRYGQPDVPFLLTQILKV